MVVGAQSYNASATATSGLAVLLALAGSSTGCSLVGTMVTFTGVGTCVINANQAGNATYNPAPQVQRSILVCPTPTLVLNSIRRSGAQLLVVNSCFT